MLLSMLTGRVRSRSLVVVGRLMAVEVKTRLKGEMVKRKRAVMRTILMVHHFRTLGRRHAHLKHYKAME